MFWFKCEDENCGKLTRSVKTSVVCMCGVTIYNSEKLEEYVFEECDTVFDIPPNPCGKMYKNNKKCDEEMRKMVYNNGRY